MPATSPRSVDLPLPDAPATTTNSPWATSRFTSHKAGNEPAGPGYDLETSRSAMSGAEPLVVDRMINLTDEGSFSGAVQPVQQPVGRKHDTGRRLLASSARPR